MKRFRKQTPREFYHYTIFQNVFGKLDFEGSGFNGSWRVIPARPSKDLVKKLEDLCACATRSYICQNGKLPLLVRAYLLEGIDCTIIKIDNEDYQII